MKNHMTLPEELFLLGIRGTQGSVSKMHTKPFEYAISSAVLMELALRNKIDTDTEGLFIIDTQPTGSEPLDIALNAMRLAPEKNNINFWINQLNDRYETFIYSLLNSLIRKEMLKIEHQKVLWMFKKLTYPIIGHDEVNDVRTRVHSLVFSEEIPDVQDLTIISLLNYSGLMGLVLSAEEIESRRERIEMIAKLDLIGQEIGARIKKDLDVAVAMAASMFIH